ncbi:MAG: TIGR01458 family HAD-type hydrolase, partial [Mariprofundaceae bacterium]
LDLDGVLYIGDQIIRGAPEVVAALREKGYAIAGITNTTTQPRRAIAEKLQDMDIQISEEEIFTPAALAVQVIGKTGAALFVRESLKEDFRGVSETDTAPDYVVMGDVGGEGYSPEVLKQVFGMIMDGAKLLALHKNRFWQKPDGLHLDLGPFVAAIEYATGQQATVLGKPSQDFFLGICTKLDVTPENCLMVGDDIESDIGGAQNAGLKTALVQTGKYREEFVRQTGIKADLVLPSIADLPDALHLL